MFGYLIPKSYKEALEFDKEITAPDGLMQPGMKGLHQETRSLHLISKGQMGFKPQTILNAPPNHQKIRVNLIFAVKFNGRHKARLVADGSLTPDPVENIYEE